MNTAAINSWLNEYVTAWNTNDPEDIGRLFTERAVYHPNPFEEPWRGRAAIVREWLGRRDAPGTTTFRYDLLATTEDTAIVRGWTTYVDPPREFSNIWVLRFDASGKCHEFSEWWMQRPAV